MVRSWLMGLVALGCCLSVCVGCQQDLDVQQRTFHCESDADCLDGFVCRSFEGTDKACQAAAEPDADLDSATSDADATDADASDAEADPDALADAADTADTADAADTADTADNECGADQQFCSGQCRDVLISDRFCGSCDVSCSADTTCVDGSCLCDGLPTARLIAAVTDQRESDPGADINLTAGAMDTLSLDGSPSEGDISRYSWEVQSRPSGSTSQLSETGTSTTSLLLDLYGEYEVSLTVYNGVADASCQSATVSVTVAPDSDIAIQLTWDTPSDADQTDEIGTDLDLHYLHPNGSWNDGSWDLSWNNRDPDWGTPDDPDMIVDDTDGAGPEHIVHDNLEPVHHRVGVHYFSGGAVDEFGPSYATVRVYINGTLAAEHLDKQLSSTNQFWEVGYIDGDTMQFGDVDELDEGYPSQ